MSIAMKLRTRARFLPPIKLRTVAVDVLTLPAQASVTIVAVDVLIAN